MAPILNKDSLEGLVSLCDFAGITLTVIGAVLLLVSNLANRPLKRIVAAEVQQERAVAEENRLKLEREMSDARTAQHNVEIDLSKQRERTAKAELALLELQGRVKPRKLTAEQAAAFVKELKTLPKSAITLGYTAGGADEGLNLLKQLVPLFTAAGWKISKTTNQHLEIQVIGVGILVPGPKGFDPTSASAPSTIHLTPELATLRNAFKAADIDVQFIAWYPNDTGTPELVIGSKPNP